VRLLRFYEAQYLPVQLFGYTMTEIAHWNRQPGETKKAYEAFRAYRDLGGARSIREVAHKLGKSATLISRWSAENEWVRRVEAWDAHQQALADARQDVLREQRAQRLHEQRDSLIEAELRDYEAQLARWLEVFAAARLYQKKGEVTLPDGTRVSTVALNVQQWLKLSDWRDQISRQGRRALELPDSIRQAQLTGKEGAPVVRFVWVDEDDNSGHG
jgi:hypothetical protein